MDAYFGFGKYSCSAKIIWQLPELMALLDGGEKEGEWRGVELFLANSTLLPSTPPPSPLHPNGPLVLN